MVFIDVDGDENPRLTISKTKLKYIRRDGWHLTAEPPKYDVTNVEVLEPIVITKDVAIAALIEETPQPEALNVRMVKEGDDGVSLGDDSEDSSEDEDEVPPLPNFTEHV